MRTMTYTAACRMSSSSHSVIAAAMVNRAMKNDTNTVPLAPVTRPPRAPTRSRKPAPAWPDADDTIEDISSDPARSSAVSGAATPTASSPSGR